MNKPASPSSAADPLRQMQSMQTELSKLWFDATRGVSDTASVACQSASQIMQRSWELAMATAQDFAALGAEITRQLSNGASEGWQEIVKAPGAPGRKPRD